MAMSEQSKAIILASIESYVDKMISMGRLDLTQRDKAIADYKLQAKID